ACRNSETLLYVAAVKLGRCIGDVMPSRGASKLPVEISKLPNPSQLCRSLGFLPPSIPPPHLFFRRPRCPNSIARSVNIINNIIIISIAAVSVNNRNSIRKLVSPQICGGLCHNLLLDDSKSLAGTRLHVLRPPPAGLRFRIEASSAKSFPLSTTII